MRTQLLKLAQSVRSKGIGDTLALARKNIVYEWRWYLDRRFDRLHGTETSDRIELADLDVVGTNRAQGVYYEPTSTGMFRRIMAYVSSRLRSEDFTFIDFGSGKGRTLLMASDQAFRAIVGVEFSRELHETAERNIALYRGRRQRCANLSSVHNDATVYELPAGDLLIYFFNPFLPEVMARVLDNVARAARASGARVALVYLNPLSSEVVDASGLFVRREDIPLPHDPTREFQRKCCVFFSWPDEGARP